MLIPDIPEQKWGNIAMQAWHPGCHGFNPRWHHTVDALNTLCPKSSREYRGHVTHSAQRQGVSVSPSQAHSLTRSLTYPRTVWMTASTHRQNVTEGGWLSTVSWRQLGDKWWGWWKSNTTCLYGHQSCSKLKPTLHFNCTAQCRLKSKKVPRGWKLESGRSHTKTVWNLTSHFFF